MNQIKFSNQYPKLWDQETAELIAIRILEPGDFNTRLLEYDTTTHDKDKRYHLDTTRRHLQLIFIGDAHIPFCTLRTFNTDKAIFYNHKIGQQFQITMNGG